MVLKKTIKIVAFCLVCTASSGMMAQQNAGINLKNLDTSVKPGTDFYQFATGGWQKLNPIPPEYPSYGAFEVIDNNNRERLVKLINEQVKNKQATGSIGQKIADVYEVVMDSVTRNKMGYAPIKPDLAYIYGIKNVTEMPAKLAHLQRIGVDCYFGSGVMADAKNSSMNLVTLGQSGLSLGQRDYYVDTDTATLKIMKLFRSHVVKMFEMIGYKPAIAKRKMQDVLKIETAIAQKSFSQVQLRDPQANYNKMTMAELIKKAPFDWKTYFEDLGVKEVKDVNLAEPIPVATSIKIINTYPLIMQKNYLEFHLLNAAAGKLSDKFEKENFAFYGKVLSGTPKMQPRWKRAQAAVDEMLGEGIGRLYVEKYFPAVAKERMLNLVHNLQKALAERIQAQEWMSDTTKAKAVDKLKSYYIKIGYPNKWRDYSKFIVKKDCYWDNFKRHSAFESDYEANKAGKPVDRDEWQMTPQEVNAYYDPYTNEICFPAGILQSPFFDMTADDAFNYGAIGTVIGHEMTHGFDDEGCQFDKYGNMVNWWIPSDAEKFKARTKVMSDFFDKIVVLPGLHANGELTLGENIADHGGLNVSFQAYKNATKDAPLGVKDGFTADQRFFLAFAGVWAGEMRNAEIRELTKSDPHSLAKWRVDGALPQIDAWYDAFNIQPGDPLYLPKDKRVNIW
jgi:putative endopeptidase